jgi:tetratricopeptide (TPR) repeat protein
VLDNAEQLEGAALLEALLVAAPRLQLLVTSRARLGVAAETAVALDGLPLPDDDETDVEVLRCNDAVALLESRALAASGSFDLAAQARGAVRLVHAVEGLPLAIELAAVWTRLLPMAEIADEIARSVDLLEGDPRSNRGLRASFAQSWRLLSDAERTGLPRLALLPGDFDRDMALQVADTPLSVLAALVDKSLLRADGSGRFSMHPLLRSCAAERADSRDEIASKLAGFVAHWMGQWDGTAAAMQSLIARITRELAHVRAAWAWALARGDASVIVRMGRPVSNFFEQQGMWSEGTAALQGAVQALRRAEAADLQALGVVLRGLSALQYRVGDPHGMETSAQEMMTIARSISDVRLMRYAINMSGLSLQQRGHYEDARQRFAEGLARAVAEGSAPHTALFTANIAKTDAFLGRYEDALAGHERALSLYRALVDHFTAAIELIGIALVHRVLGRPALAVERLNEALVACTQHGFKSVQCTVSLNLALAFDELRQAAVSSKWLATALREARQHGERQVEILAILASSRRDCEDGDPARARVKGWEALTLADRSTATALHAQCVAAFGEIMVHEGRLDDGVALIRWSAAQPSIDRLSRDLIERRAAVLLERRGHTGYEPSGLSPGLPLAAVLAIAAAPGD